jgi:ABC-2 type transport system ATP-binding protein
MQVKSGDILGLIGSNGAGKSSLLEVITGIVRKYGGSITYDGIKVEEIKDFDKKIGFVSQDIALYEKLSGLENLKFWSKLYGVSDNEIHKIISDMGMEEYINDKVSTYSGGMKRKLNIASSIMHFPEIIVMDEPLVGIDKNWINEILDIIKKLSGEGRIIIISSHRFQDFSKIWNRICVLKEGSIVAYGDKEKLLETIEWGKKVKTSSFPSDNLNLLEQEGIIDVESTARGLDIKLGRNPIYLDKLLEDLKLKGENVEIIGIKSPQVEDLYEKFK